VDDSAIEPTGDAVLDRRARERPKYLEGNDSVIPHQIFVELRREAERIGEQPTLLILSFEKLGLFVADIFDVLHVDHPDVGADGFLALDPDAEPRDSIDAPATASSRIAGSLSNVLFEHVSIDSVTNVATKVDDCQIVVTSATFDAPVKNN
jgi:hypothetical protein